MKSFVVADPRKCIGCGACEIACASANSGMEVPEAARIKAAFNPRLNLIFTPEVTMPVQCRQCEDAPCAQACPVDGIVFRNGAVQVLKDRCIGCKMCMIACPLGAITILPKGNRPDSDSELPEFYANKCELCTDRAEGPACVQICPADAFILVNESVVRDAIKARRQNALRPSN